MAIIYVKSKDGNTQYGSYEVNFNIAHVSFSYTPEIMPECDYLLSFTSADYSEGVDYGVPITTEIVTGLGISRNSDSPAIVLDGGEVNFNITSNSVLYITNNNYSIKSNDGNTTYVALAGKKNMIGVQFTKSGSNIIYNFKYSDDSTDTAQFAEPIISGKTLIGFSTTKGATVPEFTLGSTIKTVSYNRNTTFYAVYQDNTPTGNTYTIKSNDGSKTYVTLSNSENLIDINFMSGDKISYNFGYGTGSYLGNFIPDTIEGKELVGFSTTQGATSATYLLDVSYNVNITSDTTFYAVYKDIVVGNTYTIKSADGATTYVSLSDKPNITKILFMLGTDNSTCYYTFTYSNSTTNEGSFTPSTISGKRLIGFSRNKDASSAEFPLDSEITISITSDTVFYAIYEDITVTGNTYTINSNDGSKTYLTLTNKPNMSTISLMNSADGVTIYYSIGYADGTNDESSFTIDKIEGKEVIGYSRTIGAKDVEYYMDAMNYVNITENTAFYIIYIDVVDTNTYTVQSPDGNKTYAQVINKPNISKILFELTPNNYTVNYKFDFIDGSSANGLFNADDIPNKKLIGFSRTRNSPTAEFYVGQEYNIDISKTTVFFAVYGTYYNINVNIKSKNGSKVLGSVTTSIPIKTVGLYTVSNNKYKFTYILNGSTTENYIEFETEEDVTGLSNIVNSYTPYIYLGTSIDFEISSNIDLYVTSGTVPTYNKTYKIQSNDGTKVYVELSNKTSLVNLYFIDNLSTVNYYFTYEVPESDSGTFNIDIPENSYLAGFSTVANSNVPEYELNEFYTTSITESTTFYPVFKSNTHDNIIEVLTFQNIAEKNRVDKSNYLTHISTINGTIRNETSIVNPTIIIENELQPNFNYVYIPQFGRYYFVNNITSIRNKLWELNLNIDVLMTYKNGILSCNGFIDRNENEFNPNIIDKKRVIEEGRNISIETVTNEVFTSASGSYILNGFYVSLNKKR